MRRGTRVGQAYIALTADGSGINEEIIDSVDEAGPEVEKKGDEHGQRYGDRFGDGFSGKLRGIAQKASDALGKRLGDSGTKMGEGAGEDSANGFTRAFERHLDDRFLDRLGARVGGNLVDAINFAISEEADDNPLQRLVNKWTEDVSRNVRRRRGGDLGSIVGRFFGAGSRSNILNFMGRTIGNVINLTQRLGSAVSNTTTVFMEGFRGAADGAGMLTRTMSGLSAVASRVGVGLSGAMAAIGTAAPAVIAGITLVINGLVGTVSALTAAIIGLVGVITSALAGSLLVLAGTLSAVAAAAGMVTIAFLSMTDAQKKAMSEAFAPLKAEIVGLGQLMIREMIPAFSVWSANLQRAFMLLAPMAQALGRAFAQAGNSLTAAFSGPGFQQFATAMGTYLPSIVNRLASALGSLMNGLGSMFAALMPYVNRFAGYLARVAQEFANWAASAKGQNSIVQFVERAWVSIQSFWGFLKQFMGWVMDVLFHPTTQAFGQTLFDGLANAFETFRQKVADGSFEKWLNNAIYFASALWSVMKGLADLFFAFYNSNIAGMLAAAIGGIGQMLSWVADIVRPVIDLLGTGLSWALGALLKPINLAAAGLMTLVNTVRELGNVLSNVPGFGFLNTGNVDWGVVGDLLSGIQPVTFGGGGLPSGVLGSVTAGISAGGGIGSPPNMPSLPSISMPTLQGIGSTAISQTNLPKPSSSPSTPKAWQNPYTAYANSLIKQGPTIMQQIRQTYRKLWRDVRATIHEVAKAESGATAREGIVSSVQMMREQGKAMVEAAQNAVNTAAQNLASASSPKEAKAAMKELKKAQLALDKAVINRGKIVRAANILAKQKVYHPNAVKRLVKGMKAEWATLTDYAIARKRVAAQLEEAKQRLMDAIALRDDYKQQVAEAGRTFGNLLTAQAQTIDGVEQALTHRDITGNLKDRLAQIKEFQSNLRLLMAQGLSNEAFKQIVDAGVEEGGAYAKALVEGGVGAVREVNNLVSEIGRTADVMANQASRKLYQAGVDAARGLVDGLTSIQKQLDNAAARLGRSIAQQIKTSLGIKSPSRVMIAMMNDVGDGMAVGLGNQHAKVSNAAASLADKIAVSPAAAAYAANVGETTAVSGNRGDLPPITIVTPTKDPRAVALETINELTGRLP